MECRFFAVHQDMRNHTRVTLTIGKGALLSMSVKQKINTKSSAEAEFVGVDHVMNFMVWSKLFLTDNSRIITQKHQVVKLVKLTFTLYYNTLQTCHHK